MEKQLIESGLVKDTLDGLLAEPKYLLSKYFYDDKGTSIFRDIMNMPEYYLTDCEHEIFTTQKEDIAEELCRGNNQFNLIELGSGDGFKTRILLRTLSMKKVNFTYIPVDISEKANDILFRDMQQNLPLVKVEPLTGDYLEHISSNNGFGEAARIIFFLGSNIGNFGERDLGVFLGKISEFTRSGDKVLIGFDLKKSPEVIMKAYNDPHGHTSRFNLNLLERLNREMDADFNIDQFEHHTQYNPETGEVKSYLVSLAMQRVYIGALQRTFGFKKWESMFTELSRKFDLLMIRKYAKEYGFKVIRNFTDSKEFFVDSLWEKV
jgi:L-histidine Nalpha-methyltransferase